MSDIGNKAVFAANLKWYMDVKDVNQADVCRALGFKTTAFSAWMTAKAYPRIDRYTLKYTLCYNLSLYIS